MEVLIYFLRSSRGWAEKSVPVS
nr:unnamed protein product [Callosobruchus analis]CAI5844851.1 unnamed protein product [Callosobruchus analis]